MLAAVDIGNTNITIGFFKDGAPAGLFKTDAAFFKNKRRAFEIFGGQMSGMRLTRDHIEAVYVCSVVPLSNETARRVLRSFFKIEPSFIGKDVPVPLVNRYRIPSQVGQDRLVSAYAGLKMFGAGLIIVDFGTAITFDVVSKKSEYLGGLIFPGLKLMREALHKNTALLPYVELARPIEIIGRDTVSSIRAGIIYGTAALCDGVIERLRKKECRGYKVVATGGDAPLVKPHAVHIEHLEDSLVLKGLHLIFKSQRQLKR